jgi:hypothetical protein
MKTLHDLPFEAARWKIPEFICYRVGTCHGLYGSTEKTYDIINVHNAAPGNGHFEDVLQWFEASCRRDGKSLRIIWVLTERFKQHLIEKRGFVEDGPDDVIKHFT